MAYVNKQKINWWAKATFKNAQLWKIKKNIEHINDQLHMNILKVHKICNKPSSKRWQKLTAKHS